MDVNMCVCVCVCVCVSARASALFGEKRMGVSQFHVSSNFQGNGTIEWNSRGHPLPELHV